MNMQVTNPCVLQTFSWSASICLQVRIFFIAINPKRELPTIIFPAIGDGGSDVVITQSCAILEFLEESEIVGGNGLRLLPADPLERAKVRFILVMPKLTISVHLCLALSHKTSS